MTPKKRTEFMWSQIENYQGVSIPWYLMSSWLYYEHDISLLIDEDYDKLCIFILERWDSIEHRHKHLLDRDSLKAGTGYSLKEYPTITTSAAVRLATEDKHFKWHKKKRVLEKPQ